MTDGIRLWLGAFVLVALFSLASIYWLDKPTALLVHDVFGGRHISGKVIGSPLLSVPLISTSIFVIFGLAALAGRQFSQPEIGIVLSDVSVVIATAIKDQLKILFGRTWPDSWASGILSLIHDNVYGFHFFQTGQSFESFPSGHAAVIAAAVSPLWILFPRLRIACAICVVATDVALVLTNLHFVSDVVAGTFVGLSSGLFVVSLWRTKIT